MRHRWEGTKIIEGKKHRQKKKANFKNQLKSKLLGRQGKAGEGRGRVVADKHLMDSEIKNRKRQEQREAETKQVKQRTKSCDAKGETLKMDKSRMRRSRRTGGAFWVTRRIGVTARSCWGECANWANRIGAKAVEKEEQEKEARAESKDRWKKKNKNRQIFRSFKARPKVKWSVNLGAKKDTEKINTKAREREGGGEREGGMN